MEKVKTFIEKYNLLVILFFTFLSASTYVFRQLSFTNTIGIIYRAIISVIIVFYLVLFILWIKPKVSRRLLIFVSLYFSLSILSLFISPIIAKKDISNIQYLLGVATIFSNIASVYLFIESSKLESNIHSYNLFINIFIGVVCFMCLYTYLFQHEEIYQTLNNVHGWNFDVTSIFYEKTTYGFFLTAGSAYAILHSLKKRKYLYLIFPLFFIFNALLSRNKTSILIIGLLIVFSMIYLLKKHFASHKILSISILSFVFTLTLIFVLLILFVPSLSNIRYFIKSSIFNDGIVVIKDRFSKWGNFLASFNNAFNIFFGYGERISRFIIADNVTDNAYLASLETGGIFKLIIHLILIITIYNYSLKKKQGPIILFIITIILISGMFEDNYIFGFNVTSLATAPIIYSFLC